jgi:hypothetical protein
VVQRLDISPCRCHDRRPSKVSASGAARIGLLLPLQRSSTDEPFRASISARAARSHKPCGPTPHRADDVPVDSSDQGRGARLRSFILRAAGHSRRGPFDQLASQASARGAGRDPATLEKGFIAPRRGACPRRFLPFVACR